MRQATRMRSATTDNCCGTTIIGGAFERAGYITRMVPPSSPPATAAMWCGCGSWGAGNPLCDQHFAVYRNRALDFGRVRRNRCTR